MIENLIYLFVAIMALLLAYKLLTTPHPAWRYMTEEEKEWYKKWFIFPRLWK